MSGSGKNIFNSALGNISNLAARLGANLELTVAKSVAEKNYFIHGSRDHNSSLKCIC